MVKSSNEPGNIIDLASVRFPVGSKAWHPIYRLCHVVESVGTQRKIRALQLGSIENKWEYIDVHVNELQRLINPVA